ncbi:hypothetical protein ACFSVJ_19790 [Prauserella oleivorans]
MIFLSTQFRPVDEAERFRSLLGRTVSGVSYVTIEDGPFAGQVRSQVDAGSTQMGLLGGLHGDLAPLAGDYLEDLTDLLADLGERGWPAEYLELAKAGTDRTWYIPWANASYVLAAHTDALEHLPRAPTPSRSPTTSFWTGPSPRGAPTATGRCSACPRVRKACSTGSPRATCCRRSPAGR